ncbi:MAG TPA: hypothetical protein VFI39_07610 [Gemmatimonadales bacterium]|nr:hypothetical protein [Gemmatimonadales bacterium]
MHSAWRSLVRLVRPSSRRIAVGATLLVAAAPLAAQAYTTPMLACAAFHQSVDGTVRTELNGQARIEQAGRDGRILAHAAADTGLHLSIWWDSLTVWRDADGGRIHPSTEGLLGGRYVGALGAHGGWREEQVPFIPDDVAAIADLTGVPDDLFPHLPPRPLAVGRTWNDGAELAVTRLTDSTGGGQVWQRYTLSRKTLHREERNIGAPTPAKIEDGETETGRLTWSPTSGPERWERSIVAETRIVADPKRAFRSRLEQRIVLQREAPDSGACRVGS